MSSKYIDFFETRRNSEKTRSIKKKEHVSFDNTYSLPKDIKRRESVEKGFKEYLSDKDKNRSKGYISPPFEVSKVPSPIYGYHKPNKFKNPDVDYTQLKEEMKKDSDNLILFKECLTEEKSSVRINKTKKQDKAVNEEGTPIKKNKKAKKVYGLNRSLADIIEEEKSGNNKERRGVPGLFENNKKM
ncbi:MAG: hypothetical protein ACTH1V_01925 [Alkalibacterium gilvum]|uniref:Uncharacterized protein n=1 Tax=Alkalibacterium gilvum TaxID=1130080 RepID=A0A1H6TDG3_9LACT|nr:hypothetical protein [Alkalibacterium gilvum]SEI78119.1 hypothetical protein SAMN04488113_11934 [Alkalibacterium gilvum]